MGRWLFEKYDGVRGFWNPIKKAFFSRKGNRFTLPEEVVDAMPTDIFLDGEFWYFITTPSTQHTHHKTTKRFGRDNFQEALKISNRTDASEIDWSNFKYMVFDMPNHQTESYRERYARLGNDKEYPCHISKIVFPFYSGKLHIESISIR